MSRQYNLDLLKNFATVYVVLLHFNGYVQDTFGYSNFSCNVKIFWIFLEALAYPAIHIFVLVSSWLYLEKNPSKFTIFSIWLKSIVVCFVFFIGSYIFNVNIGGGRKC